MRRQGIRRASCSAQRGLDEQGAVQGLSHPFGGFNDGPTVDKGTSPAAVSLWPLAAALLGLLHRHEVSSRSSHPYFAGWVLFLLRWTRSMLGDWERD